MSNSESKKIKKIIKYSTSFVAATIVTNVAASVNLDTLSLVFTNNKDAKDGNTNTFFIKTAKAAEFEVNNLNYENYCCSYTSKNTNGYFWGISQDPQLANNAVFVERLGKESKDGIQKWRVFFNRNSAFYIEEGKTVWWTNKPRFAISLTKDLSIQGNLVFTLYDRAGNQISKNDRVNLPTNGGATIVKTNDSSHPFVDNYYYFNFNKDSNKFRDQVDMWDAKDQGIAFKRFSNDDYGNSYSENFRNQLIDNSDKYFFFQLNTGPKGSSTILSDFLTVDFTTKRDKSLLIKKENLGKVFYSGVNGTYFSYDHSTDWLRSNSLYGKIDLNKDSDNDGLPDEYEKMIGSNPNNSDTDGDGRLDGAEIEGSTILEKMPKLFLKLNESNNSDNIYKISGTDPLIAPPKTPKKILGKIGENIIGTSYPNTTMALGIYKKGSSYSSMTLGQCISDKNGNYNIEIGKFLKRTNKINKYGNDILLEDENNPSSFQLEKRDINSNDIPIDNGIIGDSNYEFKVETWSDGFDNRPLFTVPEKSNAIEKVNTIGEKYPGIILDNKIYVDDINNLNSKELFAVKFEVFKLISTPKFSQLKSDLRNGVESIKIKPDGSCDIELKGNDKLSITRDNLVIQKPTSQNATNLNQVKDKIFADTSAPTGTNIYLADENNNPIIGGTVNNGRISVTIPDNKRQELNNKKVRIVVEEPNKLKSYSDFITLDTESPEKPEIIRPKEDEKIIRIKLPSNRKNGERLHIKVGDENKTYDIDSHTTDEVSIQFDKPFLKSAGIEAYIEDSVKNISKKDTNTVKKKVDAEKFVSVAPFEKTVVNDINNLTEADKKRIEAEIKKHNNTISGIIFNNDASVDRIVFNDESSLSKENSELVKNSFTRDKIAVQRGTSKGLDSYSQNKKIITGKTKAKVDSVVDLFIDGEKVATAKVKAASDLGNYFELEIPDNEYNKSDLSKLNNKLVITEKDLLPKDSIITIYNKKPTTPILDEPVFNSTNIKVHFNRDNINVGNKLIVTVGGTEKTLTIEEADKNNGYKSVIIDPLKSGTIIKAKIVDSANNESDEVTKTLSQSGAILKVVQDGKTLKITKSNNDSSNIIIKKDNTEKISKAFTSNTGNIDLSSDILGSDISIISKEANKEESTPFSFSTLPTPTFTKQLYTNENRVLVNVPSEAKEGDKIVVTFGDNSKKEYSLQSSNIGRSISIDKGTNLSGAIKLILTRGENKGVESTMTVSNPGASSKIENVHQEKDTIIGTLPEGHGTGTVTLNNEDNTVEIPATISGNTVSVTLDDSNYISLNKKKVHFVFKENTSDGEKTPTSSNEIIVKKYVKSPISADFKPKTNRIKINLPDDVEVGDVLNIYDDNLKKFTYNLVGVSTNPIEVEFSDIANPTKVSITNKKFDVESVKTDVNLIPRLASRVLSNPHIEYDSVNKEYNIVADTITDSSFEGGVIKLINVDNDRDLLDGSNPISLNIEKNKPIKIVVPKSIKEGTKFKLQFAENGKDDPSKTGSIILDKHADKALKATYKKGENFIEVTLPKDVKKDDIVKVFDNSGAVIGSSILSDDDVKDNDIKDKTVQITILDGNLPDNVTITDSLNNVSDPLNVSILEREKSSSLSINLKEKDNKKVVTGNISEGFGGGKVYVVDNSDKAIDETTKELDTSSTNFEIELPDNINNGDIIKVKLEENNKDDPSYSNTIIVDKNANPVNSATYKKGTNIVKITLPDDFRKGDTVRIYDDSLKNHKDIVIDNDITSNNIEVNIGDFLNPAKISLIDKQNNESEKKEILIEDRISSNNIIYKGNEFKDDKFIVHASIENISDLKGSVSVLQKDDNGEFHPLDNVRINFKDGELTVELEDKGNLDIELPNDIEGKILKLGFMENGKDDPSYSEEFTLKKPLRKIMKAKLLKVFENDTKLDIILPDGFKENSDKEIKINLIDDGKIMKHIVEDSEIQEGNKITLLIDQYSTIIRPNDLTYGKSINVGIGEDLSDTVIVARNLGNVKPTIISPPYDGDKKVQVSFRNIKAGDVISIIRENMDIGHRTLDDDSEQSCFVDVSELKKDDVIKACITPLSLVSDKINLDSPTDGEDSIKIKLPQGVKKDDIINIQINDTIYKHIITEDDINYLNANDNNLVISLNLHSDRGNGIILENESEAGIPEINLISLSNADARDDLSENVNIGNEIANEESLHNGAEENNLGNTDNSNNPANAEVANSINSISLENDDVDNSTQPVNTVRSRRTRSVDNNITLKTDDIVKVSYKNLSDNKKVSAVNNSSDDDAITPVYSDDIKVRGKMISEQNMPVNTNTSTNNTNTSITNTTDSNNQSDFNVTNTYINPSNVEASNSNKIINKDNPVQVKNLVTHSDKKVVKNNSSKGNNTKFSENIDSRNDVIKKYLKKANLKLSDLSKSERIKIYTIDKSEIPLLLEKIKKHKKHRTVNLFNKLPKTGDVLNNVNSILTATVVTSSLLLLSMVVKKKR